MRDEYLKILYENDVKSIYHFTNVSNLESIIKNGICNRNYMDNNNISYYYTDKNRLDSQKNCISFSIGNVYKNMLVSKKNKQHNDWIVFELNAENMISKYYDKIFYCKYNASSPSVINILNKNKEYLKSIIAFKNMFENKNNYIQGELLLDDNVPFENVINIFVSSLQIKMIVNEILKENNIEKVGVIIKKEMF